MNTERVRKFRENLRVFERELAIQNNSGCCCGVSISQCHALMELAKIENLTLNELSERLSLDKSTVSRTVDSLVKLEYINREIPAENRRTTNISLTKNGEKVCQEINEGNDKYYQDVFEEFSEQELSQFLNSFETVVKKMNNINMQDEKC